MVAVKKKAVSVPKFTGVVGLLVLSLFVVLAVAVFLFVFERPKTLTEDEAVQEGISEFVRLTGYELPSSASDIMVHTETGLDAYAIIRFTALAPEAEAYAETLVETPPKLGGAPGLSRTNLEWVPEGAPTGSSSACVSRQAPGLGAGAIVCVLLGEEKDGKRIIWADSFTT